MRILLVSQMYPSPAAPDLGVFVRDLEQELASFGHELERAVLDTRSGGKGRYLRLLRRTLARQAARRRLRAFPRPGGPDRRSRGPRAARRHGAWPGRRERRHDPGRSRRDTRRRPPGRSRDRRLGLPARAPGRAAPGSPREDRGDRLRRRPRTIPAARAHGWPGAGLPLRRVADGAEERPAPGATPSSGSVEGTLTFVGDGPLRVQLEGRRGDSCHRRGPARARAGLPRGRGRALPAVARGAVRPVHARGARLRAHGRRDARSAARRSSSATARGCSSTLSHEDELAEALRAAAALPVPNPVARAAAEAHGLTAQARRVEAVLLRAARGRPA